MKKLLAFILVLAFVPNVYASWEYREKVDRMDGTFSAYASSSETQADPAMSFPYADVRSSIVYSCDNKTNDWAYLWFSTRPNLSGGDNEDGYSMHTIRGKFDSQPSQNIRMIQRWGGSTLQLDRRKLNNSIKVINNMKKYDSLLISLDWYGQGNIYFEYDLIGASVEITKARESCYDNR